MIGAHVRKAAAQPHGGRRQLRGRPANGCRSAGALRRPAACRRGRGAPFEVGGGHSSRSAVFWRPTCAYLPGRLPCISLDRPNPWTLPDASWARIPQAIAALCAAALHTDLKPGAGLPAVQRRSPPLLGRRPERRGRAAARHQPHGGWPVALMAGRPCQDARQGSGQAARRAPRRRRRRGAGGAAASPPPPPAPSRAGGALCSSSAHLRAPPSPAASAACAGGMRGMQAGQRSRQRASWQAPRAPAALPAAPLPDARLTRAAHVWCPPAGARETDKPGAMAEPEVFAFQASRGGGRC